LQIQRFDSKLIAENMVLPTVSCTNDVNQLPAIPHVIIGYGWGQSMIFNSGLHLISNRGTFHRLYRSSHHYLVLTGPVY